MTAAPLLETKFHVPGASNELVPRARLIERLDAGLRRKLILISAPAGFGKTTLLAEWAATCGAAMAWLSLDDGDNDLARFVSYLAAALRAAGVALEEHARGHTPEQTFGEGGSSRSFEPFLTAVLNETRALPGHIVLVLDDYHMIAAEAVHEVVGFLLDHMPARMHIAIATRADPPLPVARLRGRGQLCELRLVDLRFTTDETTAFLKEVMDLALADAEIAALASRTEGWIAGLQMAGLSLQGRRDAPRFIAEFSGSNRYILDYLLEEVLDREPATIQTFMLRTSILDQLCVPLCDALLDSAGPTTSDSRSILEHLERANLFLLPLDERREWYRYHRLFSDLLQQRLAQTDAGAIPGLHRRASQWFAERGWAAAAIAHALAAADTERAADLIEQHAEATLMRGEIATFLRWAGALPDETLSQRPALCILTAWMLLLSGHSLATIEPRLRQAEQYTAALRQRAAASGYATALRGMVAAFQGRTGIAIATCQRALNELPPDARFARDLVTWILNASHYSIADEAANDRPIAETVRMAERSENTLISVLAMASQAEMLARQGQLAQAVAGYERVLDVARDGHGRPLPIAGQAFIGLGDIARERNDLDSAADYLIRGIELTKQWTATGPLEAHLYLGRIKWALGDSEGAWREVSRARELAAEFDITQLDDITVAMMEAWLQLQQGNLQAVQRWAEERGLFEFIDSPPESDAGATFDYRMHKYELVILARWLIAQNRLDEALDLLPAIGRIAAARRRPRLQIEAHILQAVALERTGSHDEALTALAHALELAAPSGYVSVFLDDGPEVAHLLEQAVSRGISPVYGRTLLAALGRTPPPASATRPDQVLTDPLSERELEVLRYLDTHLSSTEIAGELFVSPNTVRFHIKNIYGKLGVHRRSEAVIRARDIGLL